MNRILPKNKDFILTNAKLVLADEVIQGTIVVKNGLIDSIDHGRCALSQSIDCDGSYMSAGLVELHTDNLERHLEPRPGVTWPIKTAAIAHDAELYGCGVTTVFDAMRVGSIPTGSGQYAAYARGLADAILGLKEKGLLKIFENPKDSLRYCIGVDVAEGLEHGDFSCIQVLDHMGNQVATWSGHVDPFDLAYIIAKIGHFYNKAWTLIERNNHGLTTIRKIQELNYPNLYVEQSVDDAYVDRLTRRAGFLTTSKTKPLIIDNLVHLLRQGESGIVDKELIDELRTYVVDARGITNAQQGCFDDRIMAYAIALFGLNSMPRKHRQNFKRVRKQFF